MKYHGFKRLKKNIHFCIISLSLLITTDSWSQNKVDYWNHNTMLTPWRIPMNSFNNPVEYIDLDNDGDPDILKTTIFDGIPVMWIDDDDDMQYGDTEGDTDNDCLLVDRNRDGKFGGPLDLCIDWADEDRDGIADIQAIVSNGGLKTRHYFDWEADFMYIIDFGEKDGIFNYVDWNKIALMCWAHIGQANFYTDYHGNTLFLKMHGSTFRIDDVRYSWENPFIFYDHDGDGLTEHTIRMVDTPKFRFEKGESPLFKNVNKEHDIKYTQKIDYVAFSWDLDNDNTYANELDFDMSILYKGEGFEYSDQINTYKSLRGLPEADKFIEDPRWRQNTQLIYPKPQNVKELVYERGKGKFSSCWFVFDEDDDCKRWERVEFYEPSKDIYTTGIRKGGTDNNPQADGAGDRGEWDEDNSGNGNLYVAPFDGRIHLYGAEWGIWRIDQTAYTFQGFGGLYDKWNFHRMTPQPDKFGLVRYTDTDNNGFIDQIEYDLDGDQDFEEKVSLLELGIDDKCIIIDIQKQEYEDMKNLFKQVAEQMWSRAMLIDKVAKQYKVNSSWYNFYKQPRSLFEKYSHGYWLAFYLYRDMKHKALSENNADIAKQLDIAYYSGNWEKLMK